MKNILVALSLFVGMFVHADEGMWFLMFLDRLNQRDMEKMGLQLTSEEIYGINNSARMQLFNSMEDVLQSLFQVKDLF